MRSTFQETVFQQKLVFRECDVFDFVLALWEGGFGYFLRDFFGVVIILAWSRDGK